MDRLRLVSALYDVNSPCNIILYNTCFILLQKESDNILVTGRNKFYHNELRFCYVKKEEVFKGGGWLQIKFRDKEPCEIEIYEQFLYKKPDFILIKKMLKSVYPKCEVKIRQPVKKKSFLQKLF